MCVCVVAWSSNLVTPRCVRPLAALKVAAVGRVNPASQVQHKSIHCAHAALTQAAKHHSKDSRPTIA